MPPFLANVVWTRARPETSGPELTMLCGCRCSGDRECASGNLYRIWHKLIRNSDSSVAALPCSSFVRLRVANSWGTDLSVNSNKHCATTTVNKPCVLGEIPVLFNSSTTPNCLLMQSPVPLYYSLRRKFTRNVGQWRPICVDIHAKMRLCVLITRQNGIQIGVSYSTGQKFGQTFSFNAFPFYFHDYLHCRFSLKASKL